jgi:hypothetical protein
MAPLVAKKKPSGKATVQESSEEPSQSPPLQSEPLSLVDPTTESTSQTQTLLQALTNTEPEADLRRQINQSLSNNLRTTISLTEEQFQGLLNQFSIVGQNQPIPTTEVPLNLHKKRQATPGLPIGQTGGPDDDPSDDLSDGSSHGSNRQGNQRQRPIDRYNTPSRQGKRSPKHADPEKLDDGISPTYASWCILLEGKLEANADWWPTEKGRIDYVFSCTKGKAQGHIEPRMSRTSSNRWTSVEEILDYLDIVFRNYFEKEEAEDHYTRLTQQPTEDFNDFHSEFSRLASLGEVPLRVWRSDLYRKLNRTFQDRLISTEHQYPTYSQLVRECQRINVRLIEYRRRFPPVLLSQRRRLPADPVKTPGVISFRRPRLLPAPKPSAGPFHPQPYTGNRDSLTPGPRTTPAPADLAESTCFNCSETGHFAKTCPNPRSTPRINEIREEDNETLGDDEATEEEETESEN